MPTPPDAQPDLAAHNLTAAAMDLYKVIQDLNAEKEKLERVIASIKELQRSVGLAIPPAPDGGKVRGRKSMAPLSGGSSRTG
jgi:hypothetical protein